MSLEIVRNVIDARLCFGIYFMGTGATLISLSDSCYLRFGLWCRTGRTAFGVYAVHFVFVALFYRIDLSTNSVLWEIGHPFLVLLLSAMSVVLLSGYGPTKHLVE